MSEIRAMETAYKGFRFRSRLEARWAMFFDRIGVKWEFEPQPVLVNGEPYLPDFLIIHRGHPVYHEVKPLHQADLIKPVGVYLAGKISDSHNWRGDILFQSDSDIWEAERAHMGPAYFICTGPFARLGSHGQHEYGMLPHCTDERRTSIVKQCVRAIAKSDLVCVHLSTPDAYGTLAEIGYAAAIGKKISLTISNELVSYCRSENGSAPHDLWFVTEMARTAYVNNFKEAQEVHASIINSMTTREYRLIAALGGSHAACMTFGDPLDVATSETSHTFGALSLRGLCVKHTTDAEAVRAHRFDRR